MNTKSLSLFLGLSILTGCVFEPGTVKVSVSRKSSSTSSSSKSISSVSVINNQIKITGTGLQGVTSLKIKNNNLNETFSIESATATQIIANASHALSIGVGQIFDLVLNSAEGAAIFPVSFSLDNGSITAVMLSSMGASPGQILKYNGAAWIPSSLSSSQLYIGTWNANTNSPDLNLTTPQAGDYYVVTTGGTQGAVTYAIGDWIISNGTTWSKLSHSSSVVGSFNGRTGLVVPASGDYTWAQINKTSSKLEDIADIDITNRGDQKILKWDDTNSKWIMGNDNTGAGAPGPGSITTTEILDGTIANADLAGSIAQAKITNLTTDLASKLGLTSLSATAPLAYNNTSGVFSITNATIALDGAMSATDKTKLNGLETLSAGNGLLERFSGTLRSNTCADGEVLKWVTLTGWTCSTDVSTDASKQSTLTNSAGLAAALSDESGTGLALFDSAPTITDPVIANISPVGDFTLTQNAIVPFTSVSTGAVANTLYLKDGKVGIGTTAPTARLTVSDNSSVLPVPLAGTTIHIGGADSTAARLLLDSFGTGSSATSNMTLRSAGGTAASPTTTASGDVLGQLSWLGYGATTYASGARASIRTTAANTWTDTAQGTYMAFYTTSASGTSNVEKMRITDSGNVGIGTNSPGSSLDVKGILRLSGSTSGYVGFEPAAVAGATTYKLPATQGTSGQVLSTDGVASTPTLSWVTPATSSISLVGDIGGSVGANTIGNDKVTSTHLLDGTILNADINNAANIAITKLGTGAVSTTEFNYLTGVTSSIQTQLAAREPTIPTGATTDYIRGDKTLSVFATDVINSVLSTYAISASAKPAIANTDTVIGAFNKVQKYINDIDGDYVSKSASTNNTVSGVVTFNTIGSLNIGYTPTNATDAVSKAYVDSFGAWTRGAGDDIYRLNGNVGIGTSTPNAKLHVLGSYGSYGAGLPANGGIVSTVGTASDAGVYGLTIASGGKNTTSNLGWFSNLVGVNTYYDQTTDTLKRYTTSGGFTNTQAISMNSDASQIGGNRMGFWTGANADPTERMSITASGNVGIGTIAPVAIFDISSNNSGANPVSPNYLYGLYIENTNTTNGVYSSIGFGNSSSQVSAGILAIHNNATGTYNSGSSATNKDTELQFQTSDPNNNGAVATKMTIKNNGYVGIGTSSPLDKLDIVNGRLRIEADDAFAQYYDNAGSNTDTQKAYVGVWDNRFVVQGRTDALASTGDLFNISLATGKVGIGTTAPTEALDVFGYMKTSNYGASAGSAAGLYLYRSQGGSVGSEVAPTSGVGVGSISFSGYRGDSTVGTGASINSYTSGAWSTTSTPSDLRFWTTPSASISPVTRMLIDPSGNVGIGTSSPTDRLTVKATSNTVTDYPIQIHNLADTMRTGHGTYGMSNKVGTAQVIDYTYDIGGAQIFNTGGAERLRILGTGNVGIGTSVPSVGLMVEKDNGAGYAAWFRKNPTSDGIGIGTLASTDIGNIQGLSSIGGVADISMQSAGGKVGIGTTSPAYPLHVIGTSNNSTASYWNWGGGSISAIASTSMTPTISIYSAGQISASVVVLNSDERIKKIIGRSNSIADLDKIMKIKVTDYSYIDKIVNGGRPAKKIIAQELERVLPNYVSKRTDFIPNVYKNAISVKYLKDSTIIKLSNLKDLKVGDKIKILSDKNIELQSVIMKIENSSIVISRIDQKKFGNKIFVYGKEVNDFRSVDYEAIGMLNVSATQELAKKINKLKGHQFLASDRNLKTNILPISDALEKLTSLDGVFYSWKKNEISEKREMGIIAQKVESVFPEAVKVDSDGFKSVAYSMLIAPIIESIKELKAIVTDLFKTNERQDRAIASLSMKAEKLEAENNAKDKKIKELEDRLQRIEARLK